MADNDDTKDGARDGEKRGGGLLKIALVGLVLLGLGAGGAYGAFAAGLFGAPATDEPDMPALVRKGDVDPYAMEADGKGDNFAIVHGEGGSEYRTAYYSFTDNFTSNLSQSPALIQVDLAVSTRRDGRVLMWVREHELAIRSTILAELAETPEKEVHDADGRGDLAVRLTAAINAVLERNEGFGGIDAVHFKAFLVQ